MRNERQLSSDLSRLAAATMMYARQQSDRLMLGDDQEHDDITEETQDLVADVLKRLEQSLDEDYVESLDRRNFARPFWPWDAWRNPFGFEFPGSASLRRATPFGRREEIMLQEILEDFRAEITTRLRRARREDRSLTESEIDELLSDLREDLQLIARRTRRRVEEDSEPRQTDTSKAHK